MQAYQINSTEGIDHIKLIEKDIPSLGEHEILVKMKACSLNYRDLLITMGGYVRNDVRPIVPLSDGAGEVAAVGAKVKRFQVGDAVIGNFFQHWHQGQMDDKGLNSALGGGIDGALSEYFVLQEAGAVKKPASLSYAQAATLPCAATTAWNALVEVGNIQAGDTILLLGTGGVSIFGLQLAKAKGAKVIITSSSEHKLQQAAAMGADHLINYKETPNWEEQVLALTGGKGVNNVLEVGGAGTFEKSTACVQVNGIISVIGILTGLESPSLSLMTIFNLLRVQGVYVGSTQMLQNLCDFIAEHNIQPVIDKQFNFSQSPQAYKYMAEAKHFGKIVITNDG